MTPREEQLAVRALRKGKVFGALSGDEVKALLTFIVNDQRRATFEDYRPGEVVFTGGDDADCMYVVLDGAFEERSATGATVLWCPHVGEVVGEEALFAENPDPDRSGQARRVSTLVCVASEKGTPRNGRLLVIDQETAEEMLLGNPKLALALARGLATDSYRLFQDRQRADEDARTWFKDRSARLQVGPYSADGTEMFVAVARTPAGDYGRFLPPPLRPVPGYDGVFLVVAARFPRIAQPHEPQVQPFAYNEVTLFAPALHPSCKPPFVRPILYTPALYPDNVLATLLGREIYGFPKRPGRTDIDVAAGTARLTLDGAESLFMAFEDCALEDLWPQAGMPGRCFQGLAETFLGGADGASLAAFTNKVASWLPYVPAVALKQVPASNGRRGQVAYDVNELSLCPFRIRRIHELTGLRFRALRVGSALPFGGSKLHWQVGYRVLCDMDLMPGEQLRRYPRSFEPVLER